MMVYDFEEVGKVFDELPQMFHSMHKIRICQGGFDTNKMGYLILGDDPNTPRCYFVFNILNGGKSIKYPKVRFVGGAKYLEIAYNLIKDDFWQINKNIKQN